MQHEIEARQVVQEELAQEVKIIVPETAEQAQQAGLVRTELQAFSAKLAEKWRIILRKFDELDGMLFEISEKQYRITRELAEVQNAIKAGLVPVQIHLRNAIDAIDRVLLEYTARAESSGDADRVSNTAK